MKCLECGKRIHADASNCFYCGAVLGMGENMSPQELTEKRKNILNSPSTVFDSPTDYKEEPYEPYDSRESEQLLTNRQYNTAPLPNKTPPPSIDSYKHGGNDYSGKPPLPTQPQKPHTPPYTPFVNVSGKENTAAILKNQRQEGKKRRQKIGTIIVIAVVLAAFIVTLTLSILDDKREREDSVTAFCEAVDLLKPQMEKEGWFLDVSNYGEEKEKNIYAYATNKSGISYKNLSFLFAVYDKEEKLVGTGEIRYDFFEKDTTRGMNIQITFRGENPYDRYISLGETIKLAGISGEPYNFAKDARGMEFEGEPVYSKAESEESGAKISYSVSLTNKTQKPTAPMSIIFPINYIDYDGDLSLKETMRVLVPPLEAGESYSETIDDVFEVWAYSETDNDIKEYLRDNQYSIGDPVAFLVKAEETSVIMEEPYLMANLTPFLENYSSGLHKPYNDEYGPMTLNLDLENKFNGVLYNVSVKVSFYDENFDKVETFTMSIGDVYGESHFRNTYELEELLAKKDHAYSTCFYTVDSVWGYYLAQ